MSKYRAAGPARIIINPTHRRWAYGIAATAVPLLVAYGAITEATGPLWLALAGAVLGSGVHGLAAANVSAGEPED